MSSRGILRERDWKSLRSQFQRGLDTTFIGRCMERMYEGDGRNRAITIAGQAFVALIPFLIVIASWSTQLGTEGLDDTLIGYFDLTGATAEAVHTLFSAPPSATGGITFLGFVILVFSLGSLARSMQRLYESAWHLEPRGMKGTIYGIGGALILIIAFAWLGIISHFATRFGHTRLVALPVELLLLIPIWAIFIRLMLSRRRPSRELFISALVSAFAQVALSWGTQLYVPRLLQTNAEQYGVIGIAFAIVSWLVIVAYLLVGSAVVGAELTDTLEQRKLLRTPEPSEEQ